MKTLVHIVPFGDGPIDTIEIQTDNGPVLINKTDFDPAQHTAVNPGDAPLRDLGTPPAVPGSAPPPAPNSQDTGNPNLNPPNAAPPNPPAPVETFVTKHGKKWLVADGQGKSAAGFNAEGYDTEAAAVEAQKASATPATPPPPPATPAT